MNADVHNYSAWALACCVFGDLECLPFFVDGMKDVEHRCGNCGVRLANWRPKDGSIDVLARG